MEYRFLINLTSSTPFGYTYTSVSTKKKSVVTCRYLLYEEEDLQYTQIKGLHPTRSHSTLSLPLKTSENSQVFGCFQGVEKGCIGNEHANEF